MVPSSPGPPWQQLITTSMGNALCLRRKPPSEPAAKTSGVAPRGTPSAKAIASRRGSTEKNSPVFDQ